MEFERIFLEDVLAVAKIHPFYTDEIEYPPDSKSILAIRKNATKDINRIDFASQPILHKNKLYATIERLVNDTRLQNTYRRSIYASITGGGFGSKPLFFATDVYENRTQRAQFGRFIRSTGLIQDGDWVITTHCAGELYRSLDLTLELLENAGASVLSAGNHILPPEIIRLISIYNINVLTGDSSQIVQIVHFLSKLPKEKQDTIKLNKIIYTSEVLTTAQRQLILRTLGPIKIHSLLGSAEAGPWAVSNPDIVGETTTSEADFIFDKRAMLVEILPIAAIESGLSIEAVPDGEQGIIVQTSLCRLRNPLVRYNTGDIGSLHSLPEHARAMFSEEDWPHLQVIRLQGRDTRFSFDWDGEYLVFEDLAALITNEDCGVLQWQVILDKMEPSLESSLEIRLLCSSRNETLISKEDLVTRIETFVHCYEANAHRFRATFVESLDGFERSKTARKVIKFVDRYNDN